MKQPEDHKTSDLLESQKRGRGRPRLENAKSQAERARLYRLNKKLNPAPMMPSNLSVLTDELQLLRKELRERDREVMALKVEQDLLIDERLKAFALVDARNLEIAELKTIKVTHNENSFGQLKSKLVSANSEISTLAYKLDKALEQNIALNKKLVQLTKENDLIKRDASHKSPVKSSRKTVTKKSATE